MMTPTNMLSLSICGVRDYVEKTKDDDSHKYSFLIDLHEGDVKELNDIAVIGNTNSNVEHLDDDDDDDDDDTFDFAEDHNLCFSTLRYNQFATMVLMYEYHKANKMLTQNGRD